MKNTQRHAFYAAIAATTIWVSTLPAAIAQENSRGTAVVCPVVYNRDSGSEGSRVTAVQAVGEAMQKAGYTLVSDTVGANTWSRLGLPTPTASRPASTSQIVRFGAAVKARYVVAPVFDFHSRSIWVDLGPKTISTATVSIVITDVQSKKVVYTRKNVQARSDEKFDPVKAGADILLTPLVSVVSGGPKTPHEQRAVQIAVVKALKDWVKK